MLSEKNVLRLPHTTSRLGSCHLFENALQLFILVLVVQKFIETQALYPNY